MRRSSFFYIALKWQRLSCVCGEAQQCFAGPRRASIVYSAPLLVARGASRAPKRNKPGYSSARASRRARAYIWAVLRGRRVFGTPWLLLGRNIRGMRGSFGGDAWRPLWRRYRDGIFRSMNLAVTLDGVELVAPENRARARRAADNRPAK